MLAGRLPACDCSQLDTTHHVMTDPVISSVQTINPQDFDSISDEVIDERDDEVVYMRYV